MSRLTQDPRSSLYREGEHWLLQARMLAMHTDVMGYERALTEGLLQMFMNIDNCIALVQWKVEKLALDVAAFQAQSAKPPIVTGHMTTMAR